MSFPNTTEIARLVGCSQQSVSRILRGKAHLHSKDLVERVQAAAEAHGYRPNLLTQGLLQGRTMTVGLMVPMRDDAFYARLVSGVHGQLASEGVLPLLSYGTHDVNAREQLLRLIDRRVDGIILRPMFEPVDARYLADVIAAKIPVVAVNRQPDPSAALHFVGTDDREGGRQAARHLLERGHRRAAYLALDPGHFDAMSPFYQRWAGFEEVFEAGGGVAECVLSQAESLAECGAGSIAAEDCLRRPRGERPTAFFLGFDQLAWGVYAAARKLGLSIPGDVAVVGFSDQAFAQFMDPPLTTVAQDPEGIGRTAAKILMEKIESKGSSQSPSEFPVEQFLTPSLVVRQSTV